MASTCDESSNDSGVGRLQAGTATKRKAETDVASCAKRQKQNEQEGGIASSSSVSLKELVPRDKKALTKVFPLLFEQGVGEAFTHYTLPEEKSMADRLRQMNRLQNFNQLKLKNEDDEGPWSVQVELLEMTITPEENRPDESFTRNCQKIVIDLTRVDDKLKVHLHFFTQMRDDDGSSPLKRLRDSNDIYFETGVRYSEIDEDLKKSGTESKIISSAVEALRIVKEYGRCEGVERTVTPMTSMPLLCYKLYKKSEVTKLCPLCRMKKYMKNYV